MPALPTPAILVVSLLTGLQIQSDAGVVATLGAPSSTHNTLGNVPTWDGNGDTQDATFTSFIDFSANTSPLGAQLIWETGDEAFGASLLYANNSTLYFRVRDNGAISDLSWQLTANQLSAGELFVGWVVDLGSDEIRLIMDGLDLNNNQTVVASAPFSGSDWSGPGGAGYGFGTSTVGGYSGLSTFVADPFTSGTINTTEGLDFFNDQAFLPSPVPEPMGMLAGAAAIGFTFFRRRRALQ